MKTKVYQGFWWCKLVADAQRAHPLDRAVGPADRGLLPGAGAGVRAADDLGAEGAGDVARGQGLVAEVAGDPFAPETHGDVRLGGRRGDAVLLAPVDPPLVFLGVGHDDDPVRVVLGRTGRGAGGQGQDGDEEGDLGVHDRTP